jgi:hypothetical protein
LRPTADFNLPTITLVCFTVSLLVATVTAVSIRRARWAKLGAQTGLGLVISGLVLCCLVVSTFIGGMHVVVSDATQTTAGEAIAEAPRRSAYVASAARVSAAVDNVLALASVSTLGLAQNATAIATASASAGASLRSLLLLYGTIASVNNDMGANYQASLLTAGAKAAAAEALEQLGALSDAADSAAAARADAIASDAELYAVDNDHGVLNTIDAVIALSASGAFATDATAVLPTSQEAAAVAPFPNSGALLPVSSRLRPLLGSSAQTRPIGALMLEVAAVDVTTETQAAARAAVSLAAAEAAVVAARAYSLALGEALRAAIAAPLDQSVEAAATAAAASVTVASNHAAVVDLWSYLSPLGSVPSQVASGFGGLATLTDVSFNVSDHLQTEPSAAPAWLHDLQAQVVTAAGFAARQSAHGQHRADAAAAALSVMSSTKAVPLAVGALASVAQLDRGTGRSVTVLQAALGLGRQTVAALAALEAVNEAVQEAAVGPWTRAWLRQSRSFSGQPGTAARFGNPSADQLRISTLEPAQDTVQRLAVGGVWAVTGIAAAFAVMLRLVV